MSVANNDILQRLEKARTSHRQFSSLHDSKGTELFSKYKVASRNKVEVTTKNARLPEVNYNSRSLYTNAGLQTSLAVNTSKLLAPNLNEDYSKRFDNQSSLIRAKISPNLSHEKHDSKIHSNAKYHIRKVDMSTKFHQNTQSSKTSHSIVLSTFAVPNNRSHQKLIKESSLNLSQNLIPEITHLTSSTSISFSPKLSSIISQHYCYPQSNTFTWVKYKIPNPPPNLEKVERKLYPHRFKIQIEEISVFSRIPTPPPHMPEAISFPLQELVPSPPPDIPWHLLGEVTPQKVRLKTDRTPNPILSIIPAPPLDIPDYLIGETLSHQLILRTDRTPNPILSIIPAPPLDIPDYLIGEILSHQLILRTDRTPNPIIPAPPLDIPDYLIGEILSHQLILRTDRAPNPIIPVPPLDIPVACGDSFDSSGSWDSFEDPPVSPPPPLDPGELHALHLQEIVRAAELREKERNKTKYQKAKLSQPNFHQLHLEEVRKTSLEREKERIQNKTRLKSKEPIKETNQQSSPRQGLSQFSEKKHFLTELKNTLLIAAPVRPSLIKPLKLFCFSSFPDLTRAYNHMSQHLTPKIYDRLSQLRTESGFKIDQAIQTGIDNPGDPYSISVGCVAGDEDSYYTFSELFDLIIYSSHHGYSTDRIHFSDLDPVSITDGYFDPNFVLSCRVLAGRSIRGFPFLPHCTRAERRGVESVVKECVCNMPHPYKGSYYSLKEIDLGDLEYLSKRRFLFDKSVSPSVVAARVTRDWPDARGLWLNRDENFMAWINEEDHVRLISMEDGGDLKSAFERYCLGVQLFEMTVLLRGHAVMKNDHIGYILTCPSNLGTGMIITLSVRLPMLLAYPGLGIILEYLRLEKRGTVNTETGEFEISNTDRLGITEVEITQSLIHGVQLLIRMERTLWSGLCLQELLREINNTELANLILVGMYHKDPIKKIMIPKYFIPMPPPDICL